MRQFLKENWFKVGILICLAIAALKYWILDPMIFNRCLTNSFLVAPDGKTKFPDHSAKNDCFKRYK